MKICEQEKCTGCGSCANICPQQCITMQNNEYGESHPVIDSIACIECGLCLKSCPNNRQSSFHTPTHCLAAWINDKPKRERCASGGIATILSEAIIKDGGCVYGTRYNENFEPICTKVKDLADLEHFKGSKYVQSNTQNIYKKIQADLHADLQVLFIGTPCQIAGLNAFLKKDYKNLLTCDLICHGVSPSSYFLEEIETLKKELNIKSLTDIRFRGNNSKDFWLTLWDKDRMLYGKPAYSQYYFAGFLKGISLRESCYHCNYAQPQRISDITIGDFIGLGKDKPFSYPTKNVSVVLINTEKGNQFWSGLTQKTESLQVVERDFAEAVKYGPSLQKPMNISANRNIFRKKYIQFGYTKAIRYAQRKKFLMHKLDRIFHYRTIIDLIKKVLSKH